MNAAANTSKGRRTLVRAGLLVFYAGLIGLSFTLGKGHTVLLDNKDSEDGSVKAFENVTVSVDGQEAIEFTSGVRDMVKVRSQWHHIEFTIDGKKTVKKFTVPFNSDMALLSLPKLFAGKESAATHFVPLDQQAAPALEEPAGNTNEFTSPDGPEATTPAEPGATPPAP